MLSIPRSLTSLGPLLALALLAAPTRADPLLQKLTFEAMSAGDDEILQAVSSLHRKGFLDRVVEVVRQHVRDQDDAIARTAARIKKVASDWIRQGFTTKERRITSSAITAIDWKPGSSTATVYFRYELTDYSGLINSFPKYKGHANLDVRTWQVGKWKQNRL
jgi:hypothetical protein